jgi:hypothetical protein
MAPSRMRMRWSKRDFRVDIKFPRLFKYNKGYLWYNAISWRATTYHDLFGFALHEMALLYGNISRSPKFILGSPRN